MKKEIIGIVGGIGPLAGLDLSKKIIEHTLAGKDQDHIPQILYSIPEQISDRTEFILDRKKENPANAISDIISSLYSMGATVIGLPCNTAYAPPIFNAIKKNLIEKKIPVKILHLIDEVGIFINTQFPSFKYIGVLGTMGTYYAKSYDRLKDFDFKIIHVSETEIKEVHQAIYHPEYGIKSNSNKISEQAKTIIYSASKRLVQKGAEVIVLGCTEIPLVLTEKYLEKIPIVDATMVLARALISAVNSGKLKNWE